MRQLLLVLAFVLSFASAAAPAPAESGFEFYEKQAKSILHSAGEKVWEAAADAESCGFHAFAIREAERAIGFDSDQADARKYLKYEKKEGKWVQDEAAFGKMLHDNTRSSNKNGVAEPEESMQKRIAKWEEDSLRKANKFVAARYAELGEVCAAKGFKDQAEKGFDSALRLDKDNEKARKGLGYTKFGKVWLTKKQDDARKAAAKAEVVKEAQKSVWEETCGAKFNKVESAHFRMESPFDVAELQAHCEAAETAYAYYLSDFGRDPGEDVFDGNKAVFILMSDDAQWNKFVDEFATQKEFTRQLSGCAAGQLAEGIRGGEPPKKDKDDPKDKKTVTAYSSTPDGRRDQVVHQVTHELNNFVWKVSSYAWLDEGLAFYYSQKVIETTRTHCVSLKPGDYSNGNKEEGGLKDWGDADGWKPLIKQVVVKKNDLPLRQIMNQPITTMPFDASVKAWSVCTYLMDGYLSDGGREKFEFFLSTLKNGGVKQDIAFQNTYDKGIETIEGLWQEWVKRCY